MALQSILLKQRGGHTYINDQQGAWLYRLDKPAVEIERLIRGLNPWPSAYTHLNGKTFKVWSAKVIDGSDDYEPGCIYHIGK